MRGLGDPPVIVIPARTPMRMAGPEIVEHMAVEGTAPSGRNQQMPDPHLVRLGNERAADNRAEGVVEHLLPQSLGPAVERARRRDGLVVGHGGYLLKLSAFAR